MTDLSTLPLNVHLGISFGYHDSAVAIISSKGDILFAEHEERLSRLKHDNSLPKKALKSAIRYLSDHFPFNIKSIGYYEVPSLKEGRKFVGNNCGFAAHSEYDFNLEYIKSVVTQTLLYRDHRVAFSIRAELSAICCSDFSNVPINFFEHHYSHAAGAFFTSPFLMAASLTLDGAGEFETVTIWDCDRSSNNMSKVWSAELPFSLGLFYSAITSYIGFAVNEGEYKVMGLSAYGSPRFTQVFSSIIGLNGENAFIDTNYFDFSASSDRLYTSKLQDLLGIKPAQDTAWVKDISDDKGPLTSECQEYCDLAYSAQQTLTQIQSQLVSLSCRLTGHSALCLSGGVALNSLANLQTDRRLEGKLYVFPPAGDAGSAIGAAYLTRNLHSPQSLEVFQASSFNPFLGTDYSNDAYLRAIHGGLLPEIYQYDISKLSGSGEKVEWLLQLLVDHKMIALHQGRGEFGPRALGNRSIIASAQFPEMKERLNTLIKKREAYRPYAPAIALEIASKYFGSDISNVLVHPSHPLRYMASVVSAPEDMRRSYPSAIHFDNSARLQVLTEDLNPLLHELSIRLEKHLGCGILLNTSLNLGYEALVGDPESAVNTLTWSCFDAALLGDYAILFK